MWVAERTLPGGGPPERSLKVTVSPSTSPRAAAFPVKRQKP